MVLYAHLTGHGGFYPVCFFPPSHPVRYLLSAMSVLIILLLSTCLAAGVFLLYYGSVTL
nr:MAG TPA: hypothetical protein [Caudoviricetes sp.]